MPTARRRALALVSLAAVFVLPLAAPAAAQDAECDSAARAGQAAVVSVYFDTGKTDVTPQHRAELQRIARDAKYQVKVCAIGQADRQGSAEFNKRIALKRAEVVADLLAGYGVPRSVLVSSSAGEAFGAFGGNAKVSGERRVDVLYPRLKE